MTSTKKDPEHLLQQYHRIPIIGCISAQILYRISRIGGVIFLICRLAIACSREIENSRIGKAAWQIQEWIRKPRLVVEIAFVIASSVFIFMDAKKPSKKEDCN